MRRAMCKHVIAACVAVAAAFASSLTHSSPRASYWAFFDANSAELTISGRNGVKAVAVTVRQFNARCAMVRIEAHADAAEATTDIDVRRAFAVYIAFAEEGVGDRRFSIASHGARQPLVPTASGVAEPQNRRVRLDWELVPGLSAQCRGDYPYAQKCTYFLSDGTKCND